MPEVTVPTVYFDQPGPANTARTLEIGRARAEQLGLRTILVATTSGDTGLRAAEVFGSYAVVAVTHSFGFKTANQQEMPDEKRAALEAADWDRGRAAAALGVSADAMGRLCRKHRLRRPTKTQS